MLGAGIELLAPGAGAVGHVVASLCEHMFVRWSNLTVEEEPQHRLPGYPEPASGGRFDAPEARDPCLILPKSALLLRDNELMKQLREGVGEFTACLSVPTLDEKAWRETEPHTPTPRARLEAVAELNRVGIPTGVLVAPLMPGINHAPDQGEPLLEAARQAGATRIAGLALHPRGGGGDAFL